MLETLLLAQNAGDAAGWGIGMFLITVVLAIAAVVLWVWALVDAIRNPALDDTMRIVWVLVIVFTGFIGAIIYLLIGRSTQSRTYG